MNDTIFHKTEPEWFSKVQDLRPGQGKRIGDALRASFNGKSYAVWDFREKQLEIYEPQLTLAEKLALQATLRAANDEARADATPPKPAMTHPQDWPAASRVWMHQAHMSNEDIHKTRAYWNPHIGRVVLPYRTLHGDASWIARKTADTPDQTGPKYLLPSGVPRGGGAYVNPSMLPRDRVVITEDLLSAYRVAWASGSDAVALQGTSLDRDAIVKLVQTYPLIVVWLDPDGPGKQGRNNLFRSMGRFDTRVVTANSSRDPKYLDDEVILAIMGGYDGRH